MLRNSNPAPNATPAAPPKAAALALGMLCGLMLPATHAQTPAENKAAAANNTAQNSSSNGNNALPDVTVSGQQPGGDFAPATTATGTKTPALLRDIPQTVNIINRAVLDTQAATSLAQALRNVPGITLSAGEGGNIGDNINLRGFSARTDIYLDGLRDRGQYTRDTFALDAVEVLKGPSSMLFGRGSTGGVINQISKKPDRRERGEASLSLGSDDYYRATIDLNRPLTETAAVRVAAFGQDTRSTRDLIQNQDWGIAPSLRLGMGSPTEIILAALVQQNRDRPDYGFPLVTQSGAGSVRTPVDAPANRYYGYTDDHFNQDVAVISATLTHKFSPNLTLKNQSQYSRYQVDASPSPLGAVSRIGGGTPSLRDPLSLLMAPRQDRDREITDRAFYNQTDLIAKLTAGALTHTLTAGLELGRDTYRENRFVWNTPTSAANINLGNPINGTRQGQRALSRSVETTADTVAAYLNDQIDLGKQWKLVAGLRWDRYQADSDLQKFPLPAGFPADTTLPAAAKTDTTLSPRAGVIFQPSDTQSYYLSYGTSFNPSAESVNQATATASLDPEKNASYEIGGKWDLMQGDLSLNGALFRIDKKNARTRDGLGSTQVLGGKVRVQGVEISVVGRLTPQWQMLGGYTLLDGTIIRSPELGTGVDLGIPAQGKAYPNTPRHTATLWSTYQLSAAWEIGGGALYSAKRFLNNFETAQIDGYTRLDATLAYRQKSYDLRINLQNLSDKKYFEASSAGRATPAKGRGAIVTLSYRF